MAENVQQEVAPDINQNQLATTVKAEQPQKMVPQYEVDAIIKGEKQKAYEKGKNEALAQVQQQTEQTPFTPAQGSTFGGMPNQDQIMQMVEAATQRRALNEHANRVANEFESKLRVGEEKYPGLSTKVEKLRLENAPLVAVWANSMDNTADIMNEIVENPVKYSNVLSLAAISPELAQFEVQKLSQSIKENQAAAQKPTPKEPLSQLKHSTIGADNGAKNVSDMRKDPRFRV